MTPTIHNKANRGDIASIVLMPGDPLRAKFIADVYLENAVLVNDVRCAYCYTGTYKGKRVSVMASGMGVGSMGIYSHELYNDYDVDTIIRVGSTGGIRSDLKLGDIILAQGTCTDSSYTDRLKLVGKYAPIADFDLLRRAYDFAVSEGLTVRVGNVFSGVAFHYDDSVLEEWAGMGCLAVEMEASTLYTEAALAGKKALAMMTVSDMIPEDTHMSSKDREVLFDSMIRTALSLI